MTTTTLGVLSLLLHRDTSFIASSDSQLAICSRVCKTWRKSAIDAIAQCAMKGVLSATGGVDRGTTTKGEPEADNNNNESRSGHTWDNPLQDLLLTEMAKMMVLRCITQNNDHCQQHSRHGGPFCLAWFDPSGIQTTEIHVVDNGFRDDGEGRRTRYHKKIAGKECCHEWRGYRTPSEVLGPFGYDDKFVFEVFIAALQEATNRGLLSSKSEPIRHETFGVYKSGAATHDHLPTFAVRGATLARPEGYCLCLEEEYIRQFHHRPSHCQGESAACHRPPPPPPLLSRKHVMAPTIDAVATRFKSRAIDLVPTVVVRDDDVHHRRQRRGVRFRSADESHATRLITPFFTCGGVEGPVTMFLVVHSDEEGCWVSGRNSRFEVGHRFTSHGDAHTVTLVGNNNHGNSSSDDDDDDDDDYDPPFQCLCRFQSDDPFRAKHLSEHAPSEDRIFRGCLTPVERPNVSCYCAVFDGKESMVRVNTREETQRRISRVSDLSHAIRYDPDRNGLTVGSGLLNGLSLGADHQFDHSLSNDLYGSDTVLYELAVFSGRMNMEDIQKMEHHLMQKHGIVAQG